MGILNPELETMTMRTHLFYSFIACLQGEVTLALARFHFFLLHRVYKTARVARVGGLPYLRARITLGGGLTFSLVNTSGGVNPPTGVNLLLVSRPFECNRALR